MLQDSLLSLMDLCIRHLKRDKITGLKYHKENFEGKIRLSAKAIAELQWWGNNIVNSCHHINITNPDITIYTDASLTGLDIADGISPSRDSGTRQS